MYQNLSHFYRNFGFTIGSKLMFINQLVNKENKEKDEVFKECVEDYNLMSKKSFESLWKRYSQVSDDIKTITI